MLVNLLASASAVSATVNARGDPTTSDCDELPSVAPVKHDFHSTPGSSGNGAPTLSYDGCYASSWYTGNVMCSDASDDPAMHCPSACQEPAPSPLLAKRVRKGVSKLTTEEFDKVVEAMWIMKRTKTAEGQAKYGKAYREYEYMRREPRTVAPPLRLIPRRVPSPSLHLIRPLPTRPASTGRWVRGCGGAVRAGRVGCGERRCALSEPAIGRGPHTALAWLSRGRT